jgi:hypothetical protein
MQYHNKFMEIDGADGRTRTGTAYATAPSRRRVYQFHHIGFGKLRFFCLVMKHLYDITTAIRKGYF